MFGYHLKGSLRGGTYRCFGRRLFNVEFDVGSMDASIILWIDLGLIDKKRAVLRVYFQLDAGRGCHSNFTSMIRMRQRLHLSRFPLASGTRSFTLHS